MLGIVGGTRTGLVIVAVMVAAFLVLSGLKSGIIYTAAFQCPLLWAG